MPGRFADAAAVMRRALELAARGIGSVEPNPAVGAVLVDDSLNLIAEGWHQRFGGPHAEIEAIAGAGARASGATLFVTLEPCCHQGKTGSCAEAILRAGIRKVVTACRDPFPAVDGKGIAALRAAGVEVDHGLLANEARELTAPFRKLVLRREPWVHAKWAMSLDGKIATPSGDSRWISNETSRELVHRIRGRMDAIVVGSRTAALDDPLLTARPPGPRTATRVVLDSKAALAADSQLVRTVREAPLIVATSEAAPDENVRRLEEQGVEVLVLPNKSGGRGAGQPESAIDLGALLREFGRRDFTNVLVEGGTKVLGSFFDSGQIDEFHVFIAPKILGGEQSPGAVGGAGLERVGLAGELRTVKVETLGGDVYINARRAPD
ncbi:MAG TPA: bifunctional diaminohydroxyphosphoribosylaminopyrimidine deaminase/5-amino-6-(5-phosphoribosylamino)uracil reductase RibD [Planctomycetaceae bacterium]|jgi:diaminohydroxyphosphoribosylaminopyrimidine deaminase/5-amino-6-(5-phosphoribosylamino)uracil reductase|nr:bifunctional diaminohydroxyphosphoribosylaminopyrimidine deaminase/5-amino-6-(5-phosphoribosylamino)uracil reductase RibD [Planctomycetaceae bacterium]